MAGLLDIFGTSGAESLGLLGMTPADIQSARDDAQAQALYGLAGRLFQGGNTGASIAEGLQQGQKLYRSAMKDQLQEQLTMTQLQEAQRKKKEEALAKALFMRGYQPAQAAVEAVPGQFYGQETALPLRDDEGNLMPGATLPVEGRAAQAASFNLGSIAPQLIALGETGQAKLKTALDLQKAMAGDLTTLAEGAQLVRTNLLTGKPEVVATGSAKQDKGPSSYQEFVLAAQNPAFADFLKAQTLAKAPKFAVDLKDPTAVAKAQGDVVKDWRGVVKDTGAMEVADRYKAAKSAVAQGNAGNKSADGALIYAIGKIYDPSGAVQEGDKATILGNRSIPDSIKAYAQKAFSGQDLLPSERNGLLSVAGQIVKSKAQNLEAQKAPYTSISKQLGGTGDLLLNPLADVLNSQDFGGDIAAQAAAELAKRRK